jgi:hypothetical protein
MVKPLQHFEQDLPVDYSDPRTFRDLPYTVEMVNKEEPVEYVLHNGAYYLSYRPIALNMHNSHPPVHGIMPQSPGSSVAGFYELYCDDTLAGQSKIQTVDIKELLYYCKEDPIVYGTTPYFLPEREKMGATISVPLGKRRYAWRVNEKEYVDMYRFHNAKHSSAAYNRQMPYKDIYTIRAIFDGFSFQRFYGSVEFSGKTAPINYIKRAISSSAVNVLLATGMLNEDTLPQYFRNACKLIYGEVLESVFNANHQRRDIIDIDTDTFLPSVDDIRQDLLPSPQLIPFLMDYIEKFYTEIEANIPSGKTTVLREVLQSVLKSKDYIEKLIRIYGISPESPFFESMDRTYRFLGKHYDEINHVGTQWLYDKR